jgi:hypothetical protein
MTDIAFAAGSHHRIVQRVENISVDIIRGPRGPQVELVASIAPDPNGPNPGLPMATSVAIHMDQSVAMILFSRLRERFLTMGWPLPSEDESPA